MNVKRYGAVIGWRGLKPCSQKGLFLPLSPSFAKGLWVKTGAKLLSIIIIINCRQISAREPVSGSFLKWHQKELLIINFFLNPEKIFYLVI